MGVKESPTAATMTLLDCLRADTSNPCPDALLLEPQQQKSQKAAICFPNSSSVIARLGTETTISIRVVGLLVVTAIFSSAGTLQTKRIWGEKRAVGTNNNSFLREELMLNT